MPALLEIHYQLLDHIALSAMIKSLALSFRENERK